MTIKELCKLSHEIAKKKGFWGDVCECNHPIGIVKDFDKCRLCGKNWYEDERNNGELIALIHSELSEALEALRHGNPKSEHIPEFSAVEEEMADVLIRIGDYCGANNLRLEEAVKAKMEFNKTRPYKHGKKF